MRIARGGISFAGLIGAAAVGAYLGAAAAGLLAILAGQALTDGSPWPAGAAVLALLGAVAGWLIAGLTRLGLALPHRGLVFTLGGLVSLPLATAIGQLREVGSVGIGLVALGGGVSVIVYVTGRQRRSTRRFSEQYTRTRR